MGCITLAEKVMMKAATNPNCQEGEILVPPGAGTSDKIAPSSTPRRRISAPRRRPAQACSPPRTT